MQVRVAFILIFAALGLAACNGSRPAPAAAVSAPVMPATTVATPNYGPVLGPDGRCTGTPTGTASAIEPGIAECDLARLKGKPATDVLVGEGKGRREVQVLYAEPGGRELYFFVDNRLDRIVKP